MRRTTLSFAPSSYKFDAMPRLNPCQPYHSSRIASQEWETRRGQFHSHRETMRTQETHIVRDRKSTRLNSSHSQISYAVFCLKKKKTIIINTFLFDLIILIEMMHKRES